MMPQRPCVGLIFPHPGPELPPASPAQHQGAGPAPFAREAQLRAPLLGPISDNVAFVRICSTTSVCLLHGLVLLPCGISGKMTIPSKSRLSLLASCSLFCYAYAAIPTTCLSCLPYC
ncbi:hypothetical protein VPH35_066412 [Triticum aestivum]